MLFDKIWASEHLGVAVVVHDLVVARVVKATANTTLLHNDPPLLDALKCRNAHTNLLP